jgi:putative DNA methylase
VAVLINKAMIEVPPKFAGRPPVNLVSRQQMAHGGSWRGAQGLAEDVRHYGRWMREEAENRIGHLYPKVRITDAMVNERPDLKPYQGRELTVIAWLWARTVKSPNPAFASVDVPLASTFVLSSKAGKEAYVEPIVEAGGYHFKVKVGKPKDSEAALNGTKARGRGANFICVMSGTPIAGEYIRAQGMTGGIGARLMAVVADGDRGRIYLPPTAEHATAAHCDAVSDPPIQELPREGGGGRTNFWCVIYGLGRFADLFTPRQLLALTTFSDLVHEARQQVYQDALAAGLPDDTRPLRDGGTGATAYAEAMATILAIGVSRLSDAQNSLCQWGPGMDQTQHLFRRQGIPMVWDYSESNVFSGAAGDLITTLTTMARVLDQLGLGGQGAAGQADAQSQVISSGKVVSTDPPYYDNIGYADLSDFFYVWMRRSLRSVFPDLFATLAVPKAEELVATPYRHGGKEKAETFFLNGMTEAMHRLAEQTHPGFPVTIYYAFKQSESESEAGSASTGWETFLDAVIRAGFGISGTWPMRTERGARSISIGTNALASSIILVCRPRSENAPTATRRQFVATLKVELPQALAHLQRGNIAPVDLAQAAIGPGMGVFTRYAKVLGADDRPMTVREALALINQTLDEALAEQEGDFDADSRWAITWFDEVGFAEGDYGRAEQLSKSKNTSVEGMKAAGILASARSKVRLLKPAELPTDWDPATDTRLSAWETVHHLVRALESGGDAAAAKLVAALGARAEVARELAYRLYQLCERRKRAAEALAYNALVLSWPEIVRLAADAGVKGSQSPVPADAGLFDE